MGATQNAAPPDPVVEALGVSVGYNERLILEDLTFVAPQGDTVCVLGESGSGKTTLLNALIGILPPVRGTVRIFGRDFYALDEDTRDAMRRRIGIVFQSSALYKSLSAWENVALPLQELTDKPPDEIDRIVRARLADVGLEGAEDKMPSELSGGMQKRLGVARALALDPDLLFFDEPTSGLDPSTSAAIIELIEKCAGDEKVTTVIITHDVRMAVRVGDRLVVFQDGRVVAEGAPQEVRRATHPLVQRFFAAVP